MIINKIQNDVKHETSNLQWKPPIKTLIVPKDIIKIIPNNKL